MKLESYEDLDAKMEHAESLMQGHFNEDPNCAMMRAEWVTIVVDSPKKACYAHKLLWLKQKEEEEL